ncbi:GNAT family N-acetyltransferase [Mycolicibacter sp. MYC123]|uniref:GNAT family N-acetyltransferase n=1 Tax=[Mycobacterium] zoologicum TaxID=2872311 RepID=A0ABU5YLW7_9MYCO|nr:MULTISPECIES: GNAT family N-acetyltransferase [unclassified Mycolicibacter]MEB3051062.1 GNAT family N-acetyltransferase [Mycolicibacter sp. MYC123]MEB3064191.1 GNAT family N-acetyltransferase [Mycolicibacter sp. MYC101]
MAIDVRPAKKSDLTALGATLGRAFHDDPVSMWMLPDADTRTAQLSKYFATSTRYHHLGGGGVEIACDGTTVGAAALWDPPHRWKQSKASQLRMLPALIWAFGLKISRGRTISDLLEDNHPEEPHWYLAVIGSDPNARGKGFGQAVMRSRLDRCDAEHCPAYLESSKLENVPYYERFGFQVTGEITLPDDGPTLWKMWRQPQ